jgi:hypothetical protein
MKALIALAAMALAMFALTTTASAATAPNAIGRWGVVQPNPRMFEVVQPNPRSWGILTPNPSGSAGTDGQNARRLAVLRPLGAIGRW